MNILITGAAGFIGFHLIKALLEIELPDSNNCIVGIDNINDYYDVSLKKDRLTLLNEISEPEYFTFIKLDLADREAMSDLFSTYQFDIVINLGAQAGVRYSIENPNAYIDSNVVGFVNILEGCRHHDTVSYTHLTLPTSDLV